MFRGFTAPFLVFFALWAIIGSVHLEISGTNSTPVWSRPGDYAYWICQVIFPALLVLAAWIAIGLVDAYLAKGGRSRR